MVLIAHSVAALLFLDVTVFIPAAVLHSFVSVATFIHFRGSSQLTPVFVAFHVFQLFARIVLVCMVEVAVRDCFGSHQKLEEADCMIAGFQKILKGLCDGSLLLDDQLRVHGPTTSLQHLLDRTEIAGVDFESLIADSSGRERFATFIEAFSVPSPPPPRLCEDAKVAKSKTHQEALTHPTLGLRVSGS